MDSFIIIFFVFYQEALVSQNYYEGDKTALTIYIHFLAPITKAQKGAYHPSCTFEMQLICL